MSNPALDPFWERVRELFHEASELPAAQRAAFLAGEDDRLRAEVESLLEAHDETGSFLGASIWELIDADEGRRLAGTSIGVYRIVRPLGHGGMGTVFLAVRDDEQFSQRVAIKLIRGGISGDAIVRRFRQERQILAALEHPNIARLLDGGTTADGLPYLAMEYVDGTPIDVYCREQGLSLHERLRLFLTLCDAVQCAHRNLVIHRDLKPANVLVTSEGVPKLLDFGIAKLTSDELPINATVTRLMTPDYASPEQLLGKPVTTASDVYSLGVLLFELLTGTKPFDSSRLPTTEPPCPSSIEGKRALRGDLDNIILMAMEPDAAERYGSVQQLADDIRRHLGAHPVLARRPTFGYRTAKFVRRNRIILTAAAAIFAVVVIALITTLRQKQLAERRFDEVRTLARSVVFEIHDAIAPLPGSTPARELLVRRALVYLDALAKEAEDNTPLQLELAGAYLRVADVQGQPYSANLGDTAGAITSYRKAVAVASAVAVSEPENTDALTLLADAHDRLGVIEQRAARYAEALGQHDRALAIRNALPDRGVRGDLALARTWVAIGDCLYVGNRRLPRTNRSPGEAYESAVRILHAAPGEGAHRGDLLNELGRAHQRLGGYFCHPRHRDYTRALAHHDAALRALEERSAMMPANAAARRNAADQLVMKATAQNMSGDAAGALAGTRRAMEVLKALAAADPQNAEAERDVAFVQEQMAVACVALGRYDDAQREYEAALAIRERHVAQNPRNTEGRHDLGSLYSRMSTLARTRGDEKTAAEYLKRAEKVREQLTRKAPP